MTGEIEQVSGGQCWQDGCENDRTDARLDLRILNHPSAEDRYEKRAPALSKKCERWCLLSIGRNGIQRRDQQNQMSAQDEREAFRALFDYKFFKELRVWVETAPIPKALNTKISNRVRAEYRAFVLGV